MELIERGADIQTWGFHLISKEATINALVTLVLDPATKDSDFPLILYHKASRDSARQWQWQ